MFKHFVSLGWYCGTAASLAKYGGRSCSSPFDWGFLGFPGVMHALDNMFEDFLNENNLSPRYVKADGLIHLVDEKNDMDFNHEISSLAAYEVEMPAVREKYRRRVAALYKMMETYPVCFVRCVRDAVEIMYIRENAEYIYSVIKKYNKRNEIVFMIPLGLDITQDFPFQNFLLNRSCTSKGRNDLRGLFDANVNILSFVRANMSKGQRAKNLLRDLLYEEGIGTAKEKEKMMAEMEKLWLASKDYAINCFRYILGREPKGDSEVEAYLKKFPLREEMRMAFLTVGDLSEVDINDHFGVYAFENEALSQEMVGNCYRFILGREPENEDVLDYHMKAYKSFADLRQAFLNSAELRNKLQLNFANNSASKQVKK